MQDYDRNLNLLSVFHYVIAAFLAVFASIPIVHLAIGIFMLNAPDEMFDGNPPPAAIRSLMGVMFTVIPALVILSGWTMAFLAVMAGRYLSQRRRYTFCLVIAGLLCIFMPFGTVLGVLTIVVLIQPEVKATFEGVSTPLAKKPLA